MPHVDPRHEGDDAASVRLHISGAACRRRWRPPFFRFARERAAALRRVARADAPRAQARALERIYGAGVTPRRSGDKGKVLTETEREILRRLRAGESLRAIATALSRSEVTVRTHIRNARAKLEIGGTAELRRRLLAGRLDDDVA
jgi:DNA-binding CsgD family transcriptional regulator